MLKSTRLVLFLFAVFAFGVISCQATEQEEVSKGDVIVSELAAKYLATTGWEENLTYTLQAQERLITDKPTLFRGFVDDIFHRNGKTFVRFSSSIRSRVYYVLEVECSRSIVDMILTHVEIDRSYLKFLDEYAVVANIQEVSKPVFALEGSALSGGPDEPDEFVIDIEPSDLFTARGTCIDIAYIGNPFKDGN